MPSERFVIPFDQAWFCESCRVVSNDMTCFNCASAEHAQQLAPWLDRERESISIPATGCFLTVIPASRKRPEKADYTLPPTLSRAS